MAMVEFSIVPIGTKTPSVSRYVAEAIKVLEKKKGIKYQLTSMGTIIEGDLNKIIKIVLEIHNTIFSKEVKRVVTTIKIDDRRDKELTIKGKIASVLSRLK